jgi:tetratricopeptide (TPR) repeat protein
MPDASPPPTLENFDDLWDYADPAGTEAKFRALLPQARQRGGSVLAELLSQIARTHSLRREFEDADKTLDEAEALIGEGMARARARLLLERGRCLNSAGGKEKALPLFAEAWELAREASEDFHAVDAAHMAAIAEPEPEAQLAWNAKALALAEASPDPRAAKWAGSLLNNIGWTLHDRGDFEKALATFERALALQEALAAEREADSKPDGYVAEEIGECLLALGREDESARFFAQAWQELSRQAWLAGSEPQRLERLGRLGRLE